MLSVNHFPGHFLIVDIGHPMTHDTILLIKKSVQNVLSLTCSIRDISRIPVFGCGVLAPSFQIIQQWKIVMGNFRTIEKNLDYLKNPSNVGAKVKIEDYRSFLIASTEKVVTDFEFHANDWKSKTQTKEKYNPLHYWPSEMQMTLITRKRGSIVLEMLKNFLTYSTKLQKIEIVEISSSGDIKPGILRNHMNFISYSVTKETVYDLDGIFKRWMLGNEMHCPQLQIVLNRECGFHIKCELRDCLINPAITTLPNTFSLSGVSPNLISQKPLYITVSKASIYKMEVLNKIGINDLCPSIFFGIPQWIYSARGCITTQEEFQYNDEIFKALCVQLFTAEIGLVMRLKPSSRFNKITPLYFIISDGMRLLMKNIVPVELRLPQRLEQVTTSRVVAAIEEEANGLVRSLLRQMEVVDFSSQLLSIGVYEHCTKHLKSELKKTDGESIQPRFSKAKCSKILAPSSADISPGEYIPKFLSESTSLGLKAATSSLKAHRKSKKNPRKSSKEEPIHPALMSPGTMAKYRKHNSDYYKLPEVMEPGVIEL